MAKSISSRTLILAALATMPGLVHSTPAPVGQEAQQAQLDSIDASLNDAEAMARRTLFSGGSKPVSFAGEALLRFIGTNFTSYPEWMHRDVTETKNSFGSIRVGMVAAPHRNLRLWSKIAFNHAWMGNNQTAVHVEDDVASPNWKASPQTGYHDPHSVNVFEDMCAGLVAKTGAVTTSSKIGGTLWHEASPLTIWKGQPRMFGWDYVPYELEQSNAQYWEYAILKGEKTGRAAWNKKPFQGLMLESVEMPWDLHYSFVYGRYEGFQKWRENWVNVPNTNGMMYFADNQSYYNKAIGLGDAYRTYTTIRVDKSELPGAVNLGVNFVNLHTDNDYAKQYIWGQSGGGLSATDESPVKAWSRRTNAATGVVDTQYTANYFLSSQVLSVDARRTLPGGLQFHVDLGMSQTDTSYFRVEPVGRSVMKGYYKSTLDTNAIVGASQYDVVGHRKSDWVPAVYAMVSYPVELGSKNYELQLSSIYAPKKFYSGTSFIIPADAFLPFEANLLGAGKFMSSDGGSPYVSNMTGSNLMVKFPVPNGHARLSMGYHKQLEDGSDMLFLPWRLIGSSYNLAQNASTTKYDGAGLVDEYLRQNAVYGVKGQVEGNSVPGNLKQARRLGNDFYAISGRRNPYAPLPGLGGGVRMDFLSTFEGFGAFKMASKDNKALRSADSLAITSLFASDLMPQSAKSTQNLSFDAAYDFARLWGGKNSLFLGFYGAINSITRNGTPIPSMATDDQTLLSGTFLRGEIVYQLTPKFYLIGMAGQETWKSSYGVAALDTAGYSVSDANLNKPEYWRAAPINSLDWKFGVGFDWDMASRVGLHVRLERFAHLDRGIDDEIAAAAGKNDFRAWLLHAETKMWF